MFKGGGDALQGLLTSTVQIASNSLGPCSPHIRAGTIRGLALCADQRWPDFPDMPTMEEAGFRDFVFATDMALLAPAKTPPDDVKWLEGATMKVLSSPQMKEKLYKSGFLARPKGGAAAWTRMTHEMTAFKNIIDSAHIPKL